VLSNRVPEGVQGGVPDGRLVRWRRDDSAQTPACARSPARHGAATAVGVHRLLCGRGTSWYEGVGALLSGLPPLQSVLPCASFPRTPLCGLARRTQRAYFL